MASVNLVNIFAEDIISLSRFYQQVFGFSEIRKHRSPIFRCLDAGKAALGFNAPQAYELLDMKRYRNARGIKVFINVEAGSKRELEAITAKALSKGGRLIKAPYITYYNFYQVVLLDPEGNVFRVNRVLPAPRKKRAKKSARKQR